MADPNSNKPGRRRRRSNGGGAGEEREKLDMSERIRKNFAGWKPNIFTIGVVISNNVTYFAILANLMNFLTNYWHVSLPKAASTVNFRSGLTALSAIMWTFLGDAYFGRYRTVIFTTAFYAFSCLPGSSGVSGNVSGSKRKEKTRDEDQEENTRLVWWLKRIEMT